MYTILLVIHSIVVLFLITGVGIDISSSDHLTLTFNHITAADSGADTGIQLSDVSSSNVGDTSGNGNDIHGFDTGIALNGSYDSSSDPAYSAHDISIDGNSIDGEVTIGIQLAVVENVSIDNNTLSTISHNGINVRDSNNLTITNNQIGAASILPAQTVTGIKLVDVHVDGDDAHTIIGGEHNSNTISGFDIGISLNNSLATVSFNTLSSDSIGIYLNHGSDNVLVDHNHINGSLISGILVADSDSATLTHNLISVDGGDGIDVLGGNGHVIQTNTISYGAGADELGDIGIDLEGVSDTLVSDNNEISQFQIGINGTDVTGTQIDGNSISNTLAAILIDNSGLTPDTDIGSVPDYTNVILTHNTIDTAVDGIIANSVSNLGIAANTLTHIGNDGIAIGNGDQVELNDNTVTKATDRLTPGGDNTGIYLSAVTHAVIGDATDGAANSVTGFLIGIGLDDSSGSVAHNSLSSNIVGINITHSDNGVTVDSNTIDSSDIGINVFQSTAAVTSNVMTHITGDGVDISDSAITVTSNTITGDSGVAGIALTDVSGSGNLVDNNNTTGFGTGIALDHSYATVSHNTLTDNSNGISILGSSAFTDGDGQHHTDVDNNTISGAAIGITISGSNGVEFASNNVTGDGTNIGVLISDSDNADFSGDSLISNAIGIKLDHSQSAAINGVALSNNGTGLFARNGSGGTIVSNSQITGGSVGILLDGNGTSMHFGDSNISFTGTGGYFVLQNGAMQGQTLDASQQFFNGTRAINFSDIQLADAENLTVDGHLGLAVGSVFYRSPPPTGPSATLLNQLLQNNEVVLNSSFFSSANQVIGNTGTIIPYIFRVQDINLSLLTPGGNAPVAGEFGNLSPSAGGNNSYAGLTPSADGNGSEYYANEFLANPGGMAQ